MPYGAMKMTLTDIDKIALSKAVSSKVGVTEVGVHPISFTVVVKVEGTVTKGDDYEQTIHASADGWKIALIALSKLNGITIEALVRESIEGEIDTSDIVRRADAAAQTIKDARKVKCSGKTTSKLNVTIEVMDPIAVAA